MISVWASAEAARDYAFIGHRGRSLELSRSYDYRNLTDITQNITGANYPRWDVKQGPNCLSGYGPIGGREVTISVSVAAYWVKSKPI